MRDAVVLPDPPAVAEACAQRLVSFLLEAQSLTSPVHLALTGGSLGIAVLDHVRTNPLLGAVSWPDVHFWWGDERFVSAGSEERNDLAAKRALLDHLPEPPGQVHGVAATESGLSLDEAAAQYSAALRRDEVVFDLILLGVGPDGHVASIFPGLNDGAGADPPAAFAVPDSPKPPPPRVSLTLDTINAAREVWLVAAGAAKAQAVALALRSSGVADAEFARLPDSAPVARVKGRQRTLWLVDTAAATQS
jgi:6-phosphogluconolactonase